MIVSKQEMQRLLRIEQEYNNALIEIEEITKSNANLNRLLKLKQQEVFQLSHKLPFIKMKLKIIMQLQLKSRNMCAKEKIR